MSTIGTHALRSARFYWRQHVTVALSVAAATAVLVGALVVGSSMRGSLQDLTARRLQGIDELLIGEHFFSRQVARRLQEIPGWSDHYEQAEPAILFPVSTVETADTARRTVAGVTILGVEPTFWKLADAVPPQADELVGDGVLINRKLADELGWSEQEIAAGSAQLTVRIPKPSLLPSDSALGHKRDLLENLVRLPVVGIVPDDSLGRLAIHPGAGAPRLAYLSLEFLQQELLSSSLAHRMGTEPINVVFLAGRGGLPRAAAHQLMMRGLDLEPSDLGLTLKRVSQQVIRNGAAETVFEYWSLTTERLVFRSELSRLIEERMPGSQPLLTYLVNQLSLSEPRAGHAESIPYSMVAGINLGESYAPESVDGARRLGALADDELVLNEWAMRDLGAQIGDRVTLTYYLPESTHGELTERTVEMRLVDGARLVEPVEPFRYRRRGELIPAVFDEPPTLANDPDLTPEVPGLTDSESIDRWDLPFSTSERIRPADDDYWNDHRTTPKGFINLATARRMWSSRFGDTTGFRLPAALDRHAITGPLRTIWWERPELLGLNWVRIKEQGLNAAGGSTPFDWLFLGLSSFVIASAVILLWLLFRLNLEQRTEQLGLLLAVGFHRRRLTAWYGLEGALVAGVGSLLGVGLGLAYAAAVIWLLRTWWTGAVGQTHLQFFLAPDAVAIGLCAGLTLCLLTIGVSIARARRRPARELLAGRWDAPVRMRWARTWMVPIAVGAMALGAVGLAAMAARSRGESQALFFLGAGFLILVALVLGVHAALGVIERRRQALSCRTLPGLAAGNLRRQPLRSMLTIGLMATATFLIVAMSAFRLRPSDDSTGGMAWIAHTVQPLFANLNTPAGQRELLGREHPLPESTRVYPWRLKPGEDASCTNPYQSSQPRVLGATEEWIRRFDGRDVPHFHWAATDAKAGEEHRNPWRMLERTGEPIPCVIDKNTAVYSLKIYSVGQEFTVRYDSGQSVTFRLVGMLENSILQGSIIVGESDFVRAFPEVSGYRQFLIAADPQVDTAIGTLRERLAEQGFSAQRSLDLLQQLMAVQNTYLSAFQTLGALGLLLGTFGLAAVQWRSMIERRRELALMRAMGYAPRRLATLLFLEQTYLLAAGLGIGMLAAAVTTVPHAASGGASVPWLSLAAVFAVIFLIGSSLSGGSARAVHRVALIPALRNG